MKSIVADESVDFRIVTELRNSGHDVYSIAEENPTIKENIVLKIAFDKQALLLTEDKDFGELVFRLQLKHNGVLLIRLSNDPTKILLVSDTISKYYEEMIGRFSVLDDKRLRIKE